MVQEGKQSGSPDDSNSTSPCWLIMPPVEGVRRKMYGKERRQEAIASPNRYVRCEVMDLLGGHYELDPRSGFIQSALRLPQMFLHNEPTIDVLVSNGGQ